MVAVFCVLTALFFGLVVVCLMSVLVTGLESYKFC